MVKITTNYYFLDYELSQSGPILVGESLPPQYGQSEDTPVPIPALTQSLSGAKVIIENISDWFYDEDTRHKGGTHRYANGFHVWLTTQTIIDLYGRDDYGCYYGYLLYEYTGKSPSDYIVIDIPTPAHGHPDTSQYPWFEYITSTEKLYVFILLERWQVCADGSWEWERRMKYMPPPYHVATSPTIYVKSSINAGSDVFINNEYAGEVPLAYMPLEDLSGGAQFNVVVKSNDPAYEDYEETVTLNSNPSSMVYHHTIIPKFQPKKCKNPTGELGDEICIDYDRAVCDNGEWVIIEEDSPECGYPKPTPEFDVTWDEEELAPISVRFTDTSEYNPTGWLWNFGDGNTSTEQNPVHTYNIKQEYDVTLTATNQSGNNSITKTIRLVRDCKSPAGEHGSVNCIDYDRVLCDDGEWIVINPDSPDCGYPKPTAEFNAIWGDDIDASIPVAFSDMSEYNPTSWLWTFGDGNTSTAQHPIHTYAHRGIYDVTLVVSNQSGNDSITKTIRLAKDCKNPVGEHGDETCIDYDRALCDNGKWIIIEEASPECGYPEPTASFQAKWSNGSPPLKVAFTDASEGNPTSWLWDFGDGNTSTEQNPVHIYTEPGQFVAELTVTNKIGSERANITITVLHSCNNPSGRHGDVDCIEYDKVECDDGEWIVIEENSPECEYPKPIAKITHDFDDENYLTIHFTDESTNGPTEWLWDFGDGNTSTAQNPIHTYRGEGIYIVSLTSTNHIGSGDTKTILPIMSPDTHKIASLMGATTMFIGGMLLAAQRND